jgi:hypothetical protein
LAVPSLALWLLVLQREPLLSSLPAQNPSSPTEASSTRVATSPREVQTRKLSRVNGVLRSSGSSVRRLAATENAATNRRMRAVEMTASVRVAPAQTQDFEDSSPQIPASAARDAVLARQWQEIQALAASAPRPTEVRLIAASDFARAASPARIEVAFLPRPARQGISTPRRSAQLSDKPAVPRLRTAQWRASMPRMASLAENQSSQMVPSRVSMPLSSAPTTVRLVSETLDTDDGRVDEMRSVVDDFRATLAPEETPEFEAEDEEWG